MNDVTRLLSAIERGDAHASEELLPLVYRELRRMAQRRLAREQPGQTLQATAPAVYVTNEILNPEHVGAQYGFLIAGNGVGTATFHVGTNGDAFGVANNTVMTVMDLLLAVDAQTVNGVLYNGNTAKRNTANAVFGAINQAGGI